MRRRWSPQRRTERRESYGNAGAVESVESQKEASPSFHEPLGNLAEGRRDSHIPQLRRRGGWESGKPRAGFPLSHRHESSFSKSKKHGRLGGASPSPGGGAPRRLR